MTSDERFMELAGEALDGLPDWVHEAMDNVEIFVEDRPPAASPSDIAPQDLAPVWQREATTMIETTMTILTQYPFQILLMAVVLHKVVRDGLENLAGAHRGRGLQTPIEAATQRQAA